MNTVGVRQKATKEVPHTKRKQAPAGRREARRKRYVSRELLPCSQFQSLSSFIVFSEVKDNIFRQTSSTSCLDAGTAYTRTQRRTRPPRVGETGKTFITDCRSGSGECHEKGKRRTGCVHTPLPGKALGLDGMPTWLRKNKCICNEAHNRYSLCPFGPARAGRASMPNRPVPFVGGIVFRAAEMNPSASFPPCLASSTTEKRCADDDVAERRCCCCCE